MELKNTKFIKKSNLISKILSYVSIFIIIILVCAKLSSMMNEIEKEKQHLQKIIDSQSHQSKEKKRFLQNQNIISESEIDISTDIV